MSDINESPDKVFDAEAEAEKLPEVADGLLAMLKAKQAAKQSETARAFAIKAVQGVENIILRLFEEGVGVKEVHAELTKSLDVPENDLLYAVRLLRRRNKHQLRAPKTGASPERKKVRHPASDAKQIQTEKPKAPDPSSENDRMAHESDEDYMLRKRLEALNSSSSRKKFIGGSAVTRIVVMIRPAVSAHAHGKDRSMAASIHAPMPSNLCPAPQ